MSNAPNDNNFDIAGFLLAGNIMLKLVEKGVIDMHDANDIIARTRAAYQLRDSYKMRVLVMTLKHIWTLSSINYGRPDLMQ